MLEKLSVRERNLLLILLGVFLISIIYFGLAKYLYPQYRMVKDEYDLKRQSLIEVNGRISQLSVLENKNNQLINSLQGLTHSFNKDVSNGINYYFIGKHGKDTGVMIREMIPQPYQDYDMYIKIPLKMTIRGKYMNVLRFIEQVEKDMPNTSEIISLEILPVGWDKLVIPSEGELETNVETNEENNEDNNDENPEDIVVKETVKVNTFSQRRANLVGAESDPDVDVFITLITYAIKSPEMMKLAQEKPVGRIDAFSPTIDMSIIEPDLPEEDMDEELFPGGMDSYDPEEEIDDFGSDNSGSMDVEGDKEESELIKPSPSVPEVIIEETGDYSFPVRDIDRNKEENN